MDEPGLANAVIAADMMTERLPVLHSDQSVYETLNAFTRSRLDVLPVVSRGPEKRWLGMLTRERVFRAVRSQVEDMQRSVVREHDGLAAMQREGQLQELVAGLAPAQRHEFRRLFVPLQAVGKSLREADFRRNFGAQVIAVEQADGAIQCPPDIDAPLRTDQRLIAIVHELDDGGLKTWS